MYIICSEYIFISRPIMSNLRMSDSWLRITVLKSCTDYCYQLELLYFPNPFALQGGVRHTANDCTVIVAYDEVELDRSVPAKLSAV